MPLTLHGKRRGDVQRAEEILAGGGIGVMLTDTIYGIVGSAFKKNTVEKIYQLRKRNLKKPMVVLLHSAQDLRKFRVTLSGIMKKFLTKKWPGKVSVILPCPSLKFSYLHRGTKSVAFRVPAKKSLRKLLVATGPLVAPSANYEGMKPARTIGEARKYFGNRIDFYLNEGRRHVQPSKLFLLNEEGNMMRLR